MYIHLGSDTVVNMKHIIGIFDMETTSISRITREFLKTSEEQCSVVNVSEEIPKSYVVCQVDGKPVVYISQISTTTLTKRSGFMDGIAIR
ncbi:MAG: extracellular matrix regulator RemB [Eubacteriales bacterium]